MRGVADLPTGGSVYKLIISCHDILRLLDEAVSEVDSSKAGSEFLFN